MHWDFQDWQWGASWGLLKDFLDSLLAREWERHWVPLLWAGELERHWDFLEP